MNKRIKNKRYSGYYTTAKQRRKNKALCERYPFLIPRNVWNDKILWEYDKKCKKYSYTLAEEFPAGWWKAFGLLLCEDLRSELIRCNYLNDLRILEIKEKYGGLRFYTGPVPIDCNVDDIIENYSVLSENICIKCGKPDVCMLNYYGWISPYCEDCYTSIEKKRKEHYGNEYDIKPYASFITQGNDEKMADERVYIRYSVTGNQHVEVDISDIAEKIRNNYKGDQH